MSVVPALIAAMSSTTPKNLNIFFIVSNNFSCKYSVTNSVPNRDRLLRFRHGVRLYPIGLSSGTCLICLSCAAGKRRNVRLLALLRNLNNSTSIGVFIGTPLGSGCIAVVCFSEDGPVMVR